MKIGDPVIYRGKTYSFPGEVCGLTDDSQVIVRATVPPYTGMKHIFGPSQLELLSISGEQAPEVGAQALEWYAEKARSAQRYMKDKEGNGNRLLALLTELALDGGGRAALENTEAVKPDGVGPASNDGSERRRECRAATLNDLAADCHAANVAWWQNPTTGEPIDRNKGELLCLIHSEISEAMEGERKNLMDDKLPHRRMAEVELADALIRIFDYAGAFGYDLQGAYEEKMAYNATRADHKHEARLRAGGKKW